MTEILAFLANHCGFMFRPHWFRIVESEVDESFGGNAVVVLESNVLRIQITNDRGTLAMEFQPLGETTGTWYSPGLLKGLLEGNRGGSERLDADWAAFLEHGLEELESRLVDAKARADTIAGLKDQARRRANDLFR
jgi:hypothetical protein